MSVIDWLFEAELEIGSSHILWREVIGNLIGLASAVGGMRRAIWAWPVGIVGNVLLFTVFFGVAFDNPQGTTLYGQAARQVFFIAVSIWGWYRWHETRGHGGVAVVPRWATAQERRAYLTVAGVSLLACWAIFRAIGVAWPAPEWYFLADSWIFVGSVLATYAMARGWVDFWVAWLAVDLVGVPELIYFEFYPSAALYAIYGAFVVWGFVVWRRAASEENPVELTAGAHDEVPA